MYNQNINMANQIISFKDINVNELKFSEPVKNARGGHTVYVSYNDNKIITQIPKGSAPFGLSAQKFDDDSTDAPPKYTLNVKLEDTGNMGLFRSWLNKVDETVIQEGVKNSKEWFGKAKSLEVVKELYKPLVIESSDGKYAPTCKVKYMTNKNGEFQSSVFLDKDNMATPTDIVKGSKVSVIFQIVGIWFVGKQFGVSLIAKQTKLYPSETLTAYAFQDEDDDDDDDDEEEEEVEVTDDEQ